MQSLFFLSLWFSVSSVVNLWVMDNLESQFEPGWLKVGVAAELARRYGEEGRGFLSSLAALLERALPEAIEIERTGGWFAPKVLHRIVITLDSDRYSIEDGGRAGLIAAKTRVVRGIALKTEQMGVPQWLDELGAALQARASTHRDTREALEKFVEF